MLVLGHLSSWWKTHAGRLRVIINVVVTLGLAYALYRQFFVVNDMGSLLVGFRQNLPPGFWAAIAGVVVLMPANMWLEVYKLRAPLPRHLRSTWAATLGQICGGIAVGLWTPARAGEFAGRLAGTRPEQRAPILSVTALGAVAQWSPLLIGGGIALQFWRQATLYDTGPTEVGHTGELYSYLHGDLAIWIGAGSIAIGLATALLYWFAAPAVRWAKALRLPRWVRATGRALGLTALTRVDFLESIEHERGGLLVASVARYLVYLVQMSLAFIAFGLPVAVVPALVGTATLLLLHGFLPVPPAVQAVARVEFALLLFAYADPNEVSIAGASLFIFALNLGLPALYGWLFIVRRNVKNDSLSKV